MSDPDVAQGALFLIVGPSGVGKDSLIDGARKALAGMCRVRFATRVITRPVDAGGEDHQAVSADEFETLRAQGNFWHHWDAHGLKYGVPRDVADDLGAGINVVLNTSRNETKAFAKKARNVIVIHVTAPTEIVEKRLRARARESEEAIARRLDRIVKEAPVGRRDMEIRNDGTIEEGVEALVNLIAGSSRLHAEIGHFSAEFGPRPLCLMHRRNPVAARGLAGSRRVELSLGARTIVAELGWTETDTVIPPDQCALSPSAMAGLDARVGETVAITRSPTPGSIAVLRKKIAGDHLDADEIMTFVDDLVTGRFSDVEIAGFLVSAASNLSTDEIVALTRARAAYVDRQRWSGSPVVDKHSMGGIPGNRITPIVIPIVAAFGLTMPKTSSRAITSAAGTADVMEVLARVDLGFEDMRRVVEQTGACIAWNGRLTHSPVDDVMNSINRPLGLASALFDVSSIMSKKLAAGSTHVLIDLPVGPQAKTHTAQEGETLRRLFEAVGEGVGLKTRVKIADGTRPIGRGIGPVLELMDVLAVLENSADAPRDLRNKSLQYAAEILEWAGGVVAGEGERVAMDLLRSGKALDKLLEIAEYQTPRAHRLSPGAFTWEFVAARDSIIESLDIRALASVARAAGAPLDKTAGVYLLAEVGERVDRGQPLLRIHASGRTGIEEAKAQTQAGRSLYAFTD